MGASDNASDPVYADGWFEGDNGGTGFTPWNFDGTYDSTVQQRIDDGLGSGALGSSTYNDIGRAWSMFNPVEEGGGGGQRDIARSGRGFAPLQVGQTLKVVIDNPTEQLFFRGYFVRLTGGTGGVNGNICYNGTPCTPGAMPKQKMNFQMFEYFTTVNGESPREMVQTQVPIQISLTPACTTRTQMQCHLSLLT